VWPLSDVTVSSLEVAEHDLDASPRDSWGRHKRIVADSPRRPNSQNQESPQTQAFNSGAGFGQTSATAYPFVEIHSLC
jgi:hypothetical protein